MKRFNLLAVFLLALAASFTSIRSVAQPGSLDPTFNAADLGFGSGDGANSTVQSLAFQQDGKLIIAGGGGQFLQ